jgi:DNA polymerase-3 subunit alpha (Gram-positive type)
MKRFSEVFSGCLPSRETDPAVKAIRLNREDGFLCAELEGEPPNPDWAADAERRVRELMGLKKVTLTFSGAGDAGGTVVADGKETPRAEKGQRVELHLHTKMSEKDATVSVSDAAAKAAKWGHTALAVTDHGVCHSFPEAYFAGKKHGVKILYGVEGYLAPEGGKERACHIIVIAKTQAGLKSLYKLVSKAHLDNFYRRPRFSREMLEEMREGLIIGSACEAGEVFSAVMNNTAWEEALKIAAFYDYLEIQPLCNNNFLIGESVNEETLRDWNRKLVQLGRELEKPVCATGDTHFLEPEDEIYRAILTSHMTSSGPLPLYFKSTEEMLREFSYLGEEDAYEVVVENTNLVAGWVEDGIRPVPEGKFFPEVEGSAETLRESSHRRAKELYGDPLPPSIEERLEFELNAIIGNGYATIYTISQKIVQRSMEHNYLVGSRGSIGSSIAGYFAGITEVNALPPHYRCPSCLYSEFTDGEISCGIDLPEYSCPKCGELCEKDGFDIPFATFMGFEGEKVPDIDLNFSGDYHEQALAHPIELFGEENVFRAGTINTIKEKNALGYTRKYLEANNKTVPEAELARMAKGCEGVKVTTGQHPGGMIIVPKGMEIYDFCPIHRAANKRDGAVCTHFSYKAIDENLLKLDLLGHDGPTFVRRLEDLTGINALTIPLDDPVTTGLFSSSEALGFKKDSLLGTVGTVGIPEYGTRFVRGMLQKTAPATFDELVRIAGLSHGTDVWLGNAEKLIDDGKATLREVVCARDDITLYLMRMGLSGKQSLAISENVRKGKGLKAEWETEMRAAGVPEWYIESCRAIKYLFPKAHAAAYAMMSYRIAWYKAHKPETFYAVYFTLKIDDFNYSICTRKRTAIKQAVSEVKKDKGASKTERDKAVVMEVAYEMLRRGIAFAPLDVHTSDPARFSVPEPGKVSPPLMAIGGLGEAAAKSIAAERANGQFLAEDDILKRCRSVTKAHIESLRAAEALGGMPKTAQTTLFPL